MTYIPPIRPSALPVATALSAGDILSIDQGSGTRRCLLSTFAAFVSSSAITPTPTPSPTTPTSTPSTAPAGRLGYAAATTAVRNTSAAVVPVTVPAAPTRSLPAYTAYNANESPNGKTINSSNPNDKIVYRDGTQFSLTPSPSISGKYQALVNGSPLAGRVDLVNFNNTSIDAVVEAVYYYHRVYLRTNYGQIPESDTWLVVEGDGSPITDCDTEAGDPRETFLIADALAPAGDPPYGLGAHPGSIGDENNNRFSTYFAQFTKEVGNVSYINAFADGSDFSSWGNNAYVAAQDLYNVSPNKSIVPVYGLPMARGGQGINDFNAFANGTYDQYIKDGVKGYLNFFDEVHVRPGYEMNGTFMNWFYGGQNGDTATGPAWVAAFKRIYTMAHQAATEASASSGKTKTVLVTWNPCHQNYNSGYNPKDMYPGNAYVDYHGLDIYSPQYTQGPTNWSGDGQVYSGPDPDWRIRQALNPINRIHFWDYPNASADHGPTGGDGGWGMQDAIAFAKLCGKPLAIPECGSGQNFGDQGIGPCEDAAFPFYLRSRLDQAVNMGVSVLYANIWSGDEKDGGWGFLYRQRPKTAIAWASAFGGTGAALVALGGGVATTPTPSTPSPSTPAPSTPTPTGNAVARITDGAGHVVDITLSDPGTDADRHTYYGSSTGLTVNILYFVGSDGNLYIDSSADGAIVSVVVTRNGNAINSLMPNSTYN